MTANATWGAEWIAAVIAPWTISPHPNFSEKTIDSVAELALITEWRYWREHERYEDGDSAIRSDWQHTLVQQALASLVADTQAEATAKLWELAFDQNLVQGARVAAALYAAVGSSELEEAGAAADRLAEVKANIVPDEVDPKSMLPSQRLIIATLEQQRVLRLFDSRRFGAARSAVDAVLAWVPTTGPGRFEEFRVSQGISWKAQRVQRDMAVSVRSHAARAKVALEFPEARSWVSVVKSRAGWIDMRASKVDADRDATVLRDEFEAKFESTSGTQHLMRQTATHTGYGALLLAELSGSVGNTRNGREQLGKIVMLEMDQIPGGAREGIRLLRQSDSTSPLKSALNWLRNQGPTQPLRDEAATIVRRANRDRWVTEADLQVLASASDFLTKSERRAAIQVSLLALETEQISRSVSWSLHDKTWQTISQLLPDSGGDSIALHALLQYLERPELITEPLASTLAQAIYAIVWETTSDQDRRRWESWAADAAENAEARYLRRAVRSHTQSAAELLPTEMTLERAAYLADDGLPENMDDTELERMNDYLTLKLDQDAQSARNGQYSFGGYVTSNVAVAYAMRFGDRRVWDAIASLLLDRNIDGVLKEDALDRMARFPERVPKDVAQTFATNIESILESRRENHFFGSNPLPIFAEGIRLGAAFGALSVDELLGSIMSLAAGNDMSRTEAARTIPYALGQADPTWGHSLLLQLSRDTNPIVRAEAASGLVLALQFESPLLPSVRDRIRDLLQSDGLRAPVMILHAVRRLSERNAAAVSFLKPSIDALVQSAPRMASRLAAGLTKDLWPESGS